MNRSIPPSSDLPGSSLSRRRLLCFASAAGAATWLGCQPKSTEQVTAKPSRNDVPLRVIWVGDAQDIESVRRNWQGVDELPLDIHHISATVAEAETILQQLRQRATKSDVLVMPLSYVADAYSEGLVGELGGESSGGSIALGHSLPSGLRSGAARYAGKQIARPLGCQPWAMLAGEQVETEQIRTWDDYEQRVSQSEGRGAEPDATGWCGFGYLLRASSVIDQGWLFDRETMQPTITEPAYVEMLEMMQRTISLGDKKKRSPEQIGQDIAKGELDLGIGVLRARQVETADLVAVQDMPSGRTQAEEDESTIESLESTSETRGTRTTRPMLLPPGMPVALIADSCRQTSSARRWLEWLSAGDGMAEVWAQSSQLGPTVESDRGTSEMTAQDAYTIWSAQHLRRSAVRPCMQLIQGPIYYRILDEAVSECIHEGKDAKQQLEEVASQWQALTDEVGMTKQKRAWQRAAGRAV